MATVEELVVAMRSEGMTEVVDKTENVEQNFGEAADNIGDTAGQMEGFASKFKGATTAVLAGLALAVTGLLSKVPVVGESMSLLAGILDGVIYQIDKDLRPSLTELNKDLAELQENVYNAEGTFDALATAVGGLYRMSNKIEIKALQNQIKNLTGITIPKNWLKIPWGAITLDWSQAISGLKGLLTNWKSDFATFAASITSLSKKEWKKIITNIENTIGNLPKRIVSTLKEAWKGLKSWLGGLGDSVIAELEKTWNGIKQWINKVIKGIRNKIDSLKQELNQDIIAGVSISDVASGAANLLGGGGGGDSSGGSNNTTFTANRSKTPNLYIDGRELNNSQGRYEDDNTTRRGSF